MAIAGVIWVAIASGHASGQEAPPDVVATAPGGLSAPASDAPPSLPGIDFGHQGTPASLPDGVTEGVRLPDLTPMGMYRAAHPVVKGVMILLVLATVVSWTILLYKSVEIGLARRRVRHSLAVIATAQSLAEAADSLGARLDPSALMAKAAFQELVQSAPAIERAGPDGIKERVRSLLNRADAAATSRLRRGTGLLATIGAIAPFVGLFGTVWGIMNAFVGIAESRSSNLSIVAPGIAEALLATAIGLVAAIPAVVIYNVFSRRIATYRLMLGDAAATVERLVSRDLDFGRAGRA